MFQHAKLEFLIEDQRETLNLLGKSYRGPVWALASRAAPILLVQKVNLLVHTQK